MKFFATCGSLVTFALLAACGGDEGIPLSEFADRYIAAYCENRTTCDAAVSVDACIARNVARRQLEQSVLEGRIVYDPAAAAACVTARAKVTCDFTDKAWLYGPEVCDDVFIGVVADGGACFVASDCQSGRCVAPACGAACCAGTCASTVAPGEVGQACGNGKCVAGAYCDGGTCLAFVPGGGTCTDTFYCASGFGCRNGVCVDFPDRGEACVGYCAGFGDRCDVATLTCVPKQGLGGACSSKDHCQDPLYCGTGTCRAPAPAGGMCMVGTIPCAAGTFCETTTMTCVANLDDGSTCANDASCRSDYCDPFAAVRVCAPRPVCAGE